MRYPAYGEYRDSGVEWLGEVPGHWETISAKICYGPGGPGSDQANGLRRA